MKRLILSFLLLINFALVSHSQAFEIRAVAIAGQEISVEIRETTGFGYDTGDALTDFVFGIKWLSSLNVSLEGIDNSGSYNIVKSDPEKVNGIYTFQAFGANATPFTLPNDWPQNEWQEIMRISNDSPAPNLVGNFYITELSFDSSTDPNIGINIEDFTPVINGFAAPGALPAELGKLNVSRNNGTSRVSWETLSEVNVSHFEIERSSNAFEWNTLGLVSAKGNSTKTQKYYYNDRSSTRISTKVLYYRLKMVDLDGTYDYSNIKAVHLAKANDHNISIAPNPISDRMFIFIEGSTLVNRLNVYDLNGKLLHYIKVEDETSFELNLNQLGISPGVYYMSSNSAQGILKTLKFVVL